MLHLGRRGRENLATLKKSDFAVTRDPQNNMFVYKLTDEKTKNHQNDSERSGDGRMYEIKESLRCPVRSFVKYLRMLNADSPNLFQKLKTGMTSASDGVKFTRCAIGHNTLGSFMREISKQAGLSVIYTNHSLRATTVHVLDAAHIAGRHIMTVTGHRSETSLKTYSGKTDDNTKRLMSTTIGEKIKEKTSVPTSSASEIDDSEFANIDFGSFQPLSDSQAENLIAELQSDFDQGDELIRTVSIPTDEEYRAITNYVSYPPNRFQPPAPVFNNCSNITINYNIITK